MLSQTHDRPARTERPVASCKGDVERPIEAHHEASGRTLLVDLTQDPGHVEVRAPDGSLELRIVMTSVGPILQLSAVHLEIAAAKTVAVRCEHFSVDASQSLQLRSQGPAQVKAEAELKLDAEQLFFNCDDDFIRKVRG